MSQKKPEFEVSVDPWMRTVTVTLKASPNWYATHGCKSPDFDELLRKATRCVLDIFARVYGEDREDNKHGWKSVYNTMQHHIRRELTSGIKSATGEFPTNGSIYPTNGIK